MRRLLVLCFLLNISVPVAYSQRNAPVQESYLASLSIYHQRDGDLGIDLIFRKDLGPPEHTEHQMYLIAYLEKDENTILELARNASLVNKTEPTNRMLLLDVLRDKHLIAVLDSKVARRTASRPGLQYGKASLAAYAFPFHFSLSAKDLFRAINTLRNFDLKNAVDSDGVYFKDRFKLLVFVPVNDSRYADRVSPEVRGKGDFANWFANRVDPSDEGFALKTILLYFKPLPYDLQFRKKPNTDVDVFIN
jgi:hypothetical protein